MNRFCIVVAVVGCVFAATAHAGDAAVIVFLRPGQSQSVDAIAQIADVIAKQQTPPQVSVVISGPSAATDATSFAAPKGLAAKVTPDADYALAGKYSVHVWPVTVIVGVGGTEVGRLAGLPQTYASDLSAYLDFAAQKIDTKALAERLNNKHVVAPTSQQAATRHIIVANALIDRGDIEQALKEVDEGLQRQPTDVSLRIARAKLLLQVKQPTLALQSTEQLKDLVPPWQINLIRAEALIALDRWSEAKAAAEGAATLNPNPAHAHYLRGLVFEHEQDFKSAADAFRRAYETSQAGKHS